MGQSQEHSNSHNDHHDDVGYHATVGGYAIGFVLSVILTAIPFWLVMSKTITNPTVTAAVILSFAVVQVVVHVVYFLHLDAKSEHGWNMLATIFTLVLLVILVAGSIWVMHNMNEKMMPHAAHDMSGHDMQGQEMPAGANAHEGHDMHKMHDMKDMEKMP
ncbi:MAG: cytochrome o ubiquinol oxidase subunit IV [Moraxellaceae bacterium]